MPWASRLVSCSAKLYIDHFKMHLMAEQTFSIKAFACLWWISPGITHLWPEVPFFTPRETWGVTDALLDRFLWPCQSQKFPCAILDVRKPCSFSLPKWTWQCFMTCMHPCTTNVEMHFVTEQSLIIKVLGYLWLSLHEIAIIMPTDSCDDHFLLSQYIT